MQDWELRLLALATHRVMIAGPGVDFSVLVKAGYAEQDFIGGGEDMLWIYYITDLGRLIANTLDWKKLNDQ